MDVFQHKEQKVWC